jgi:hypothetical protein
MQTPPDPPRFRRPLRLILSALIVGLVLSTCVALALIPILAIGSPHETQTDRAFQVLFAALFALLGLLFMLTERQLRQRGPARNRVSFARLLFATASGLTFWAGLLLFGIALARLNIPAAADPLNIIFWSAAGLWLLTELILNARALLLPRRARAPGREIDG